MNYGLDTHHHVDEAGNPSGGATRAIGLSVRWQNGPIPAEGANGAQVETVIAAARDRLEWFQATKFPCDENARAIRHLSSAIEALESRTARREAAGIEGAYAEE